MKRRALFLDRDGIINEDGSYIGQIDRFVFNSGIFDFLRSAQDCGYLIVVVTNQSGIARGYYTRQDHELVTQHMMDSFSREGINVNLQLACFEHPEGTLAAYRRDSYWRKPKPGMILEAALSLNIDLSKSVMIGDQSRDVEASYAAGVGLSLLMGRSSACPDVAKSVTTFDEALNAILLFRRQSANVL